MKPYANESEVLQIEGLTIENRTDRISLHGEIDITRDKHGLKTAKELRTFLDVVLMILDDEKSKNELPDQIAVENTVTVDNPFA